MTTPHIDTESDEQTLLRILSPRARGCPYPLYEKARRAEPVWVEGRPVVVFGSYEACRSVLRDPRASNERRHALLYAAGAARRARRMLRVAPRERWRPWRRFPRSSSWIRPGTPSCAAWCRTRSPHERYSGSNR